MSNVKVSVIIPSFNTEKYISQCLDSVVNQTLKDIEIICVDNSSTDNTLAILNEYAEKDERIKVISKKNEGPAVSRNVGIDTACGEYICFLDSDDFVDLEMYEKMYNTAKSKDLDLGMCKIATFEDGTDNYNYDVWYFALNDFNDFEKDVFTPYDTKEFLGEFSVTVHNKIYRKSILEKNHIRFPSNILFEDEVFFYDSYIHSNRIHVIPHTLYYYRMNRPDSLVGLTSDKDYSDIVEVFKMIRNIFIETNDYEDFKIRLSNNFIPMGLWRYGQCAKKYHEYFFNVLKQDCLNLIEDEEILKNFPDYIARRVDNLINSSDWLEFDEKENFKDLSIILTCYNNADMIENSILSVINQNLDFKEHVQLVIVDDGSEDETKAICEKYLKAYPDNVVYIYQQHQGKSKAIHCGMKYTKGMHFVILNGNEEFEEDTFSKMFNF